MKHQNLFIFAILSLIGSLSALDWQGYGNVSASNLTDIWTFINNNIGTAIANSQHDKFCTEFSNHLNKLWDPAWNIILITNSDLKDTVLYGYAFRDHWMWYNGYKVNQQTVNFVIWKDYNCKGWATVGQNGAATGYERLTTFDVQYSTGLPGMDGGNDIWLSAKTIMNDLKTKAIFNDKNSEFSLVLCQQSLNAKFYGRICLVDNNQIYDASTRFWGRYLLFQTR